MRRKIILFCVVTIVLVLSVGSMISLASDSDVFYQAGQLLKDVFTNNRNALSTDEGTILATYDGTPITADVVNYHKSMNILRSDETAEKHATDFDVVNRIIESMMLLEEAERRGLLATEAEIEGLVQGAISAYSIPEGKEMIDAYLEGANLSFDDYLALLREQAPRTIARQKLLDAVGMEFCEKEGIEFTKINPPAELAAAQDAYVQELFEQNKHKIEYFFDPD